MDGAGILCAFSLVATSARPRVVHRKVIACCQDGGKSSGTTERTSPLVKRQARSGAVDGSDDQEDDLILDRAEVLQAVREDYQQRQYFLTGDITRNVYSLQTEFVDPTVSVQGLDLWQRNIRGLQSFWRDGDIELLEIAWNTTEDVIQTRWRLVCTINLPWR